jgi:DNA transformation protein and related proteins
MATTINRQFADYCCELLASQGATNARRMFGGWGIYVDGMCLAIIADLGSGEKLWLKADDSSRSRYEAAGCERFIYVGKNKTSSMNYYTAPEDAMDSPDAMRPWARLALECAVKARALKPPAKPRVSKTAAPRKSRKA